MRFLARGNGYTIFLTREGPVFTLLRRDPSRATVLRMRLSGANATPSVTGLERLPGTANYLVGRDPASWSTGIPTYGRVLYEDVYPGVDLVFYGTRGGRLEYDFVVTPGADPARIGLSFEGAKSIALDARGGLVFGTPGGAVRQAKPVIYQEVAGARRKVAGGYILRGNDQVGFRIGSYDRAKPLIIDPVLVYSTFLGGGSLDEAHSIAVDAGGNAYVTGLTASANFPTAGPIQGLGGLVDAFVTKLNPAGSAVVYSTYLGGGGREKATGLTLDTAGNAYLVGRTDSADFPVANPLQGALAGAVDAFVAKLNPTGSALVYSTYLGGSGFEMDHDDDFFARSFGGIAVDGSGSAYVTGMTESLNFPTTAGAFQPTNSGEDDVFAAKLAPSGSTLVYSTLLGGTFDDAGEGIGVDEAGNAQLTGSASLDFPTANALQPQYGGGFSDAFVTKLNATGSGLVYSTFLGGSGTDFGNALARAGSGDVYIAGATTSFDFPTLNPFQAAKGGDHDAFATKVDASGSALVYSTYLGGLNNEFGTGIAVDGLGRAHVSGTSSSGFAGCPTITEDAFLVKLEFSGSTLVYATCLGGRRGDSGLAVALDDAGGAYMTGETSSSGAFSTTSFPTTPGAFQTVFGGGASDGFVAKFFDDTPEASADVGLVKTDSPDPVRVRNNLTYTLTVTNHGPDLTTGVTVADALPAVSIVSVAASQGSCTTPEQRGQPAPGTVTCTLGSLASGGSATVTIVVKPPKPGTLTNTATVTHDVFDPAPANDTATEQTSVVRR